MVQKVDLVDKMSEFSQERQKFYEQIDDFWHDLYDTEYALWDVKVVSKSTIERIRLATKRIGQIFDKTAKLLRQLDDDTLCQLGFPVNTLPFLRLQTLPLESVIARLDLVDTENGLKLLEMNSDTPTFIKETFNVNGKVCEAFGLEDPNEGCTKKLQKAIENAIYMSGQFVRKSSDMNVVFTSHGDHEEDRLTTLYLKQVSGVNSQYVTLSQLRIIDKAIIQDGEIILEPGLYDLNGRKIDVLYRQTYPIEHLIGDEDPLTKEKVGQILLQFVKKRELAIINPPSAFLLQSKAILALIWGLHKEKHPFYTKEELSWIESYFLPTYLDDDLFIDKNQSYVKKPAFGREGDTVEIYKGTGEKIEANANQTYQDSLPVYQQFIELPKTVIKTENGERNVHYMYGSFYVSGEASAIGIRAGGQITDNESYFLPIGLTSFSKSLKV